MYRRTNRGHFDRIPGCAGAPDVHTFPCFRPDLGGGAGSISQFRRRIVFWDLSGNARIAAGPGCRLEVGLMAIMTVAQTRENFFAAIETLRSSKVRSALTVLGIVIGVSSVISMAAIIQGLNKFVQDRVDSLGSRTYFVSRFPPGTDPAHMPDKIRIRRYIGYDYAESIRDAAPDVQARSEERRVGKECRSR